MPCCTLAAGTPVITPTPPAGLFTTNAISPLTFAVSSSDVSATGPGGNTYTVTIPPETSPCLSYALPLDVVFKVTVVNQCETASFTIDPTNLIFADPPTILHTFLIGDSETII